MSDLENKFSAIQKQLGVPVLFLAAIDDDIFRKPSLGMLQHIEKVYCLLNRDQSFYCGDAAGRAATQSHKKDFSADDLKFAHNMKVRFETPESFFLGQQKTGIQ